MNVVHKGEVLRLAFGGEGILMHQGMVTFVPYTAPGDLIEYSITERKKNFAYGQLVRILENGLDRVQPLCPYFGTCGGCQLQHLTYEAQLQHKAQCVEDSLKKQAKLSNAPKPPIVPATQQWAYRRRINLSLRPFQKHFICGYTAYDQNTLVEVTSCPIFIPEEDPVILQVSSLGKSLLNGDLSPGKVSILKQENNSYLLHFHFKIMPINAAAAFQDALKMYPNWAGILATSPTQVLQWGQMEASIVIDGLTFVFSTKAFVQNHPEQSLNIYRTLCAETEALCPDEVLDLYCGIGISSLMLAQKGFKITGIESNPAAVQLAKNNAQRNAIFNAKFIQADVQKRLNDFLLSSPRNQLVIVNPPREGLDANVTSCLLKYMPQNILYISCMPPTLARDLKFLCAEKYHLTKTQAFDMFPQTSHVETMAILKKNQV